MKKILIVEDEPMLRQIYRTLLRAQKFNVFDAPDGRAALGALPKANPDIIVLDLLMPVMGGLEFLKKANLAQKYPKVKVLVLSNLSDQKTISKLSRLGATKYLLKANLSPAQLAKEVKILAES